MSLLETPKAGLRPWPRAPKYRKASKYGGNKVYLFIIVGIKGPEIGIGPWAVFEDIKLSEDR